MIAYDDVVPLLVAACPSYEGSPERAAVDDANGEYIRVTGFVRHLIRLLDESGCDCFANVFGVVEWVLADDESAAVDLIQAGFFEDLADNRLYEKTRVRPLDFSPWLGPRARRDPIIQAIVTNESL